MKWLKWSQKAAITECYCNMFGCATKLITLMLSQGKMVQKTTIYGTMCSMKQADECVWLCLEIDFANGMCCFSKPASLLPFETIINSVLKHLCCKNWYHLSLCCCKVLNINRFWFKSSVWKLTLLYKLMWFNYWIVNFLKECNYANYHN